MRARWGKVYLYVTITRRVAGPAAAQGLRTSPVARGLHDLYCLPALCSLSLSCLCPWELELELE